MFWKELDGDAWYFHFKYFTNWALTIATLYFALAAVTTRPSRLVLLLNGLAVPLAFMSCVVYWAAIFNPTRVFHHAHGHVFLPFIKEVSVHGGSMVLLMIDLFCLKFRFSKNDLIFVWAFAFAYHLFATLDHQITGTWMYPFLNWKMPWLWVPLYVTFVVVYGIVLGVQVYRDKHFSPLFANSQNATKQQGKMA